MANKKTFCSYTYSYMALILLLAVLILTPFVYAQENEAAANFTLKSSQGVNIKLSELTGQVVLLNFWASWCGTCIQQFSILEKLQAKYKNRGFTVLAINIEQDVKKARGLAHRIKAGFTILFDDYGQVSRLYEVDSIPMAILIDRNGYQQEVFDETEISRQPVLQNKIEALLK